MHAPYYPNASIPRMAALGGDHWQLSGLNSITVIFGKNGSGKSLLLRSWRDQKTDNIHYVVPERSGNLEFEPGYLRQQLSGEQRSQQAKRNYLSEYRQHVITRVQGYFAARGNVRTATLPGDPSDLERLIGQLIPDFTISLDGLANPPYRLMRAVDQTP